MTYHTGHMRFLRPERMYAPILSIQEVLLDHYIGQDLAGGGHDRAARIVSGGFEREDGERFPSSYRQATTRRTVRFQQL